MYARKQLLWSLISAALVSVAGADETLRLADGATMAYVERGAGDPALVFIHCGNCRKEIWSETLDAFDDTHRVVAMDLPGHGASSAAGRATITLEGLGADVAALVEHLKLPRVILVGNSLGGPVALEAARVLGARRVLGVVAVDTLQDVEQEWPEENFRQVLAAYEKDFASACDQMMLGLVPKSAPQATRDRVAAETCGNDPAAFLKLFRTIRAYPEAAAMAAAGVPVRAINSDAYPTNVEGNRRHARDFDVVIMEGVGHYPQVERPEEFQRHLRRWIGELSASGR